MFSKERKIGKKMGLKLGVRVCTGLTWLRIGPRAGSCEHSNGSSGTMKGDEYIDQLNKYQVLKKEFACRSYLVVMGKFVSFKI
jgi:hypothetical protein